MCGIMGFTGTGVAAPLLLEGLRRLAYRGYDSAGIATLVNGSIHCRRSPGKIENLEAVIEDAPLPGHVGIGHTRWATHGAPNEINAHPHSDNRVVLVHNGIIENFHELRDELNQFGHSFCTETDTEVVVHLISRELAAGKSPTKAVAASLPRIKGAFALAILFAGYDDLIIVARRGSPVAIGYGEGEMYIGSDVLALLPLTRRICFLEEGDWAEVTPGGVVLHDGSGAVVERQIREIRTQGDLADKGNFPHFMLKEIYEQAGVIGDTLRTIINPATGAIALPDLPFDVTGIPRIYIIACGTSYHAGLVARYWFEQIARIPVEVDIASEYRYRDFVSEPGALALFVSQSGETADTLAALRHARGRQQHVLSIVNVGESTMARESDATLLTLAGPEIGVASTKAFTTQLTTLAGLVIGMAVARGAIDHEREAALSRALMDVPSRINDVLMHDEAIANLARDVAKASGVLYLGRGTGFPIALEGALKLKEISYIHAEGYAAGEMKHGPIALIDDGVPVIVIAPPGDLFDKTASNMHEVVARGARVIFLSDAEGISRLGELAAASIALPAADPFVAPILYTIPVQLLSYHAAVAKGTDIDQPRNLAKTVTVE